MCSSHVPSVHMRYLGKLIKLKRPASSLARCVQHQHYLQLPFHIPSGSPHGLCHTTEPSLPGTHLPGRPSRLKWGWGGPQMLRRMGKTLHISRTHLELRSLLPLWSSHPCIVESVPFLSVYLSIPPRHPSPASVRPCLSMARPQDCGS